MDVFGVDKIKLEQDDDDGGDYYDDEEGFQDCFSPTIVPEYSNPDSSPVPNDPLADDGPELKTMVGEEMVVVVVANGGGGAGVGGRAEGEESAASSAWNSPPPTAPEAEPLSLRPNGMRNQMSNNINLQINNTEWPRSRCLVRMSRNAKFRRWVKRVDSGGAEHYSIPPSSCSHCSATFPGPDELRHHLVYTHPIEYSPLELPLDATESHLESGIRLLLGKSNNSGWRRKLGCACCWRHFHTELQQREHLLETHYYPEVLASMYEAMYLEWDKEEAARVPLPPPPGKQSLCVQCNKIFTARQSLRRHQVLEHPLETFFKELPSGTTKQQVQQACRLVLQKNCGGGGGGGVPPVVVQGRKRMHKCSMCYKTFNKMKTSRCLEIHTYEKHLSVVIAHLELVPKTCSRRDEESEELSDESLEAEEEEEEVAVQFIPKSEHVIKLEPSEEICPSSAAAADQFDVKEEIFVDRREDSSEHALFSEHAFQAEIMSNIPDYFGEGSNLTCPHCQKKFANYGFLDEHLCMSHTSLMYSALVPPSTSAIILRAALDQHYKRRRQNFKPGFQCLHCCATTTTTPVWTKRRFSMFLHLRLHIEVVLEELGVQERRLGRVERGIRSDPNTCPVCNARFFYARQLPNHLKAEHSLDMFSAKKIKLIIK